MVSRMAIASAVIVVLISGAAAFGIRHSAMFPRLCSAQTSCSFQHTRPFPVSRSRCRAGSSHSHRAMMAGDRAYTDISSWVVANGGYVHPALAVCERGSAGLGLSVNAPVSAGQVLVALPPRLHVTIDSCLRGAALAAVEKEVPPNKWDVRLALALLALIREGDLKAQPGPQSANSLAPSAPANKPGGFAAPKNKKKTTTVARSSAVAWATYLETLPSALALPIFYTGAQLREFEMEFPQMAGEVGGRVQLLKSVSSALKSLYMQYDNPSDGWFGDVSLRRLAWAYAIVSSRAVRLEGPDAPGVLLPLLDLANHDFAPSCQILHLGQQRDAASAQVLPALARMPPDSACLVSTAAMAAGEDVTLSYGDKLSNAQLQLEYGFRVTGNTRGEEKGEEKKEIVSPFQQGERTGGANSLSLSAEDLQFLSDDTEMNLATVDKVLDSVRPYLIADGGNCRVVSVDAASGDVAVEMEGACGSCPSSLVTLKNGIESALRQAFGDRLGQVLQVSATDNKADVLSEDSCLKLLAPVMGAVTGLGGEMQIVGVDPPNGAVTIRYKGPEKLTFGIELTLKDDSRVKSVTFV